MTNLPLCDLENGDRILVSNHPDQCIGVRRCFSHMNRGKFYCYHGGWIKGSSDIRVKAWKYCHSIEEE